VSQLLLLNCSHGKDRNLIQLAEEVVEEIQRVWVCGVQVIDQKEKASATCRGSGSFESRTVTLPLRARETSTQFAPLLL
jgi:hypothetical protein